MQTLPLGLWKKEREEVMQLVVGNFQFVLLNFYLQTHFSLPKRTR